MVSLNILDYSLVDEGSNPAKALNETAELAKLADELGYKRFWVPEQHHAFSIASSTPELLMMYLATITKRIRIGSGGVMIPHYSPYKIAENFRMLEALHPNRIDLGIGNSPGGKLVNQALNEEKTKRLAYSQQVKDIVKYLTDEKPADHRFQNLMATPVIETVPNIWMLGAGGSSTRIAAENGLALTYAHFINPGTSGLETVGKYRKLFQPSKLLDKPKLSVAVFVVIAETIEEAELLSTAFNHWMTALETAKNPKHFPSVETANNYDFNSFELQKLKQIRERAIVGDPIKVRNKMIAIAELYQADEITIIPIIPGSENRMKGIRLLADCFDL